jgi:branched-chain amino acid transport system permease protein
VTTDFTAKLRASFFAVLPLILMTAFVAVAWRDVKPEFYLLGVVQGLVIGLIAVGIVLIYRSNRIINFAAADLGAVPAVLCFLLFASWGWNWIFTSILGIFLSIVLGVVVEFVFLRRFFKAPRLIATVATIGVTQLLVAVGILLPTWMDTSDVSEWPTLVQADFRVGAATFSAHDINVLIIVPIVLVGLVCFFRYTSIGVAVRAVAENSDRASLLGIPVRRLQSVVWGLAALLAYIALYLRGPANLGQALDAGILLTALGAAVIGRMERMPTTLFAAMGLCIIDRAAFSHFQSPQAASMATRALVIAIALLLQRGDHISRIASSATSTWQATREIKRVPAELRTVPQVRLAYAGLAVLALAGLVLLPIVFNDRVTSDVTIIAIFAIIGLSLVVLTGWAGQLSLGQMGFVGISGAVAGTLATKYHWDMALVLLTAGITGAIVTVIVGIPTLRVRGLAFAVMTLAFSLATRYYFLNRGVSPLKSWVPNSVDRTELFGVIKLDTTTRFYTFSVIMLGICMLMMYSLRRSRIGRVMIGVRDNERAAQAYSVGAISSLFTSFSISGFFAGVAGGLFVLQQGALDAPNFSPEEGLRVFALLSTGFGLLLVLLVFPGGLGAAFGDARDAGLRWLAKRKGIRVPSLLADTRVDSPIPEGADLTGALQDAEFGSGIDELVEMHD